MPICGHPWMRMGAGDYKSGLGHGNEVKRAANDRGHSCVHARTAKTQPKTRFGEEGQGRLIESRVRTGDMF